MSKTFFQAHAHPGCRPFVLGVLASPSKFNLLVLLVHKASAIHFSQNCFALFPRFPFGCIVLTSKKMYAYELHFQVCLWPRRQYAFIEVWSELPEDRFDFDFA